MGKCRPPWNQTNYTSIERYWWKLSKNVLFIEFEPLSYQKLWAFFSNVGIFLWCLLTKYGHIMWPKKQISKIFYFVLILHLFKFIRKSHKICSAKALYFRNYQPKTSQGGWKTPPSAFRVNEMNQSGYKLLEHPAARTYSMKMWKFVPHEYIRFKKIGNMTRNV